ncbi:NAD(P)H-binding protein [Pedobacter sp. SYP-B3415]|uniref:NmrA family NAD(P)-binding protein n=1 Tax=Pedobacter sp. SYP-B3415 TaxID=2496641 RepID=UPI0013EA6B0F|nr:NAD(P)H-binding protein [Pedobacter sp. SYP-B3415]
MNIIIGASGQVGSMVVKNLLQNGQPVRAIVRSAAKEQVLLDQGAETFVADAHDRENLIQAFQGGRALFIITPEDGASEDVLADAKALLDNYRFAIRRSSIHKIVAISSMGAQYNEGTGNLLISNILEQTFTDSEVEQIFIRPAYYFSNWLFNFQGAKESGILPTFFPPDLQIPMVAPADVAALAAKLMPGGPGGNKIYELEGPRTYSANDVAQALSKHSGKEIIAEELPREEWGKVISAMGFTPDATKNFIEMTAFVRTGRSGAQKEGTIWLQSETTLETFLEQTIQS